MNDWIFGTVLLTAVTIPGDLDAWSQWGLAGIVIGTVMWQSWIRERRLGERIDLLEDRQMDLNERGVRAEEAMVAAINRMADRPCQKEEEKK